MNEALVSVIVPIRDGEETIEKCIASILNLDYKNYEVIIVDNGSQDSTPQLLKKYCSIIEIITSPLSIGPSEARNMAARFAKGQYIAFTDADCIVDRYWLRELLIGFNEDNVVSAGGIQEVPLDESAFGRKVFKFMKKTGFFSDYTRGSKSERIIEVEHNPSCNVMYRKDVFLQEDGFLKGLWPGEDVELDYRLKKKGYKILFNPRARIYHYRPKSLKTFLKMMYRYGGAQGFLVRKYGIFRMMQILPFLSLLAVLFLLALLCKSLLSSLLLFATIMLFWLFYFGFNLPVFLLSLLGFFSWHLGFFWRLIRN